jgi:pantoate--beta-alanine ligase
MELITKINKLKAVVRKSRASGGRIGFVPTMGALHEGHLSLVKRARECADIVVVSVFVNPLQFGPAEDFTKYPRTLSHDVELLTRYAVDFVFAPSPDEFYAKDFETRIEIGGLSDKLCGRYRPGHFSGVATVVAKLFALVEPHVAFFGQKDAQQAVVIRKMAADLKFPVDVKICPTVREPDGLALSSRNVYLNPAQRRAAPVLYRSLRRAAALVLAGERRTETIRRAIEDTLAAEPLARPQYVEIVDMMRLEPVAVLEGNALIALAVHIGDTRLIDNILVSAPS